MATDEDVPQGDLKIPQIGASWILVTSTLTQEGSNIRFFSY